MTENRASEPRQSATPFVSIAANERWRQGERAVRYIVLGLEPYEGMWVPGDDTGDDDARAIPSFATREEAEARADKLKLSKHDREILAVRADV